MQIILESFDTYATGGYTGKWQNMGGTIGAWGREFTNGLRHTTLTSMIQAIANKQTIITGIALKLSTQKTWSLFEYRDGSNIQLGLYTDASNQIIIKTHTTVHEYTGYYIPTNTWVYLEFKGTIANAPNGSYELRINGVTKAINSGIDTQRSSQPRITNVYFMFAGIGASTHWLDDIYIFDDEGAVQNDFVGDVHVEAVFPDGDGYTNLWVPFPGGVDNWENVSEIDPDDDTSFVATSGVGYIDSYTFADLITLSGSIYGLQLNVWAKKDDAGSRTLNAIVRPTTVTYSGDAPISLGDTYAYNLFHFPINPETAGYWTIAQINSGEFGIKEEA